jgi:uncharacterized protein (PEP-CTERM system associated)
MDTATATAIRRARRAVGHEGRDLKQIRALSSSLLLAWMPALVQAQSALPPLSITPYVSLNATATDNAELSGPDKRSDFILRPSAGARLEAYSGRLRGFADYELSGLAYARDSSRNEVQNALNALLEAELVENHAFIDLSGNIAQRSISAFGVQSADPQLPNDNRTEVSTFSLSPHLRGSLGLAEFAARLRYTDTRSEEATNADYTSGSALLQVNSGALMRSVTASADLSRQITDYDAGRKTTQDVLRGVVSWRAVPDLVLSLIGGRESNDLVSPDMRTHDIYGAGFRWTPSGRAVVAASAEERFFGTAHSATVSYRTPRTAVLFSDSRSVSTNDQLSPLGRGTAFDLFYLQFATVQPDPLLRTQLVNEFLRTNNISPGSPVMIGFLTSAVTVEERQELSFAWIGVRTTLTVTGIRTESSRLDPLTTAPDDLTTAGVIRQRGASIALSRRLTPLASLQLLLYLQRTSAPSVDQVSKLGALSAVWSRALGAQTSLSLGARHARFRSSTSPYDENAVFGIITRRF